MTSEITNMPEAASPNRRGLLKSVGLGLAGTAAAAAVGTAGLGLTATPARAAGATATDINILNFALNLEYLEAEYYLRAVTGKGLSNSTLGGSPSNANGGSLVPFQNTAIAYLAQTIANDELAHVQFLRTALGGSAIGEPVIDLVQSFNTLAAAAGLGSSFNPFASETDFLVGAYIFEDVGVTAYGGAAASLSPATLPYAASILGVEGYHAGAIRMRLSEIGGAAATNAISGLRQSLSGVQDNGLSYGGNPGYLITNVDTNGQAFRRTPQQVLNIVFGTAGTGKTSGLFFPYGVNGFYLST